MVNPKSEFGKINHSFVGIATDVDHPKSLNGDEDFGQTPQQSKRRFKREFIGSAAAISSPPSIASPSAAISIIPALT
jgi:hypothetical protein